MFINNIKESKEREEYEIVLGKGTGEVDAGDSGIFGKSFGFKKTLFFKNFISLIYFVLSCFDLF